MLIPTAICQSFFQEDGHLTQALLNGFSSFWNVYWDTGTFSSLWWAHKLGSFKCLSGLCLVMCSENYRKLILRQKKPHTLKKMWYDLQTNTMWILRKREGKKRRAKDVCPSASSPSSDGTTNPTASFPVHLPLWFKPARRSAVLFPKMWCRKHTHTQEMEKRSLFLLNSKD